VADGEGSGGEIHGDHLTSDPMHVKATGLWSGLFKDINERTTKKKLEEEAEEQKGLMSEFKEQLKPHTRFKERDFLTFEPKGFKQNWSSWS
jgi:hypothetical protein